jgi:hypothetical protein
VWRFNQEPVFLGCRFFEDGIAKGHFTSKTLASPGSCVILCCEWDRFNKSWPQKTDAINPASTSWPLLLAFSDWLVGSTIEQCFFFSEKLADDWWEVML